MTTATTAIIVSILSVVIAGISLGWNIYRDVILKAKIVIDFGIKTIIQVGDPSTLEYVNITATNHGPGAVNLSMVQMKDSSCCMWLLRKEEYAVIFHDYTNSLSGELPHKLEVGQKLVIRFPYDAECMLKKRWSHIGIDDYFGRVHWAKVKQVKEAVKQWEIDFGDTHNQSLNPTA